MTRTAVKGNDWFRRRLKGIEAGDVFSVPLAGGGYGFGRVMNAHTGAMIAEFFRCWKELPQFDPSIFDSGRLFAPIGFLITDIEYRNRKRPWKVIHKDPDFYPDDLYDLKFSQSRDGENWTYYTLHDHWTTLGSIPAGDVDEWQVPSILPYHCGRLSIMIERKLKEQGIMSG